jgi:hypothetical protein
MELYSDILPDPHALCHNGSDPGMSYNPGLLKSKYTQAVALCVCMYMHVGAWVDMVDGWIRRDL